MINRLQLLRNIGQFDSVATNVALQPLSLIYAENGRGKTTLTAIFRSLAFNKPAAILERHRLAAPNPPEVTIDCAGGPPHAMFRNGLWNRSLPNMAVFDDAFVDENVYSGLSVGSGHRQNLHELIVGARGVALNQQVQGFVTAIETHNTAIRARAAALPQAAMAGQSPDAFCALPQRPTIDADIQEAERALAAAREQIPVRDTLTFEPLGLPVLDVAAIERVLHLDLPGLDTAAVERVQQHLAQSAAGAEAWIADGMRRLNANGECPFCAQDLAGSPVLAHYRAFFSQEYGALRQSVSALATTIDRTHSVNAPAVFERAVRVASERRQFWARFADIPEINLDTAAIVRDWQGARDAVQAALAAKRAAPLERVELSPEARAAIAVYDAHRENVTRVSTPLTAANQMIALVKERAAAGNVTALTADLARLRSVKARYEPATVALCDAYLQEVAAKTVTEQRRDQAKVALEQYRQNVFPAYEAAINTYLGRFNAGFRLGQIQAGNTRGGPSCTYSVLINNSPVPVAADPTPGRPSFRNTLSAGDRNTLALAFFFASLDQDPGLANFIVVIDDPVSSLDDHRTLTTVQEIRRLVPRVAQVIVLSHSKTFLCQTWAGADRNNRAALQVRRNSTSSTIEAWNVDSDSITEHDRRHEKLRAYLRAGAQDGREVAAAIRPVIEGFCRVAFPEHFPPGELLGPFRERCHRSLGTATEILSTADTQELRDLIEYANRFHHDTNPAWQTVAVNDGELTGYVQRALDFCSR